MFYSKHVSIRAVELLKKYIYFYQFVKSMQDFSYENLKFIVGDTYLHIFLKSIMNLLVRSWYFLLKNCFFISLASFSVVLLMYTYTKPVLEAMFSYMGIDLSLLNSFEELEISKEQIEQFFKEKEIFRNRSGSK